LFLVLYVTQDVAFAERLSGLADRLRNLTVWHNAPEAFFEQRSELEHELRKLAGEIRRSKPAMTCERKPRGKLGHSGTIVGGKAGQFVRVEVRRRRRAA
jgi:hypothetical protein